jgi:hypothetical protein
LLRSLLVCHAMVEGIAQGIDPSSPTMAINCPRTPSPFRRLQDGLRFTLKSHGFEHHETRYTPIASMLALFVADHPDLPTPEEDTFRSALGRVLGGPLRKSGGMVAIVSPSTPSFDPNDARRERKHRHGEARRAKACTSESIAVLRHERSRAKVIRESGPEETASPQVLNFRYMDEFLGLGCAPDLIAAKVFPNAKELAESMAAFNAVRDYCVLRRESKHRRAMCNERKGILRFEDSSVTLVAVGDGTTPRTAVLFAFRTAWRCVSIDPALRTWENRPWAGIHRLEEYPKKVQDVTVNIIGNTSRVVVVAWHAHVPLHEALACLSFDGSPWNVENRTLSRLLRRRVSVVTCACCQFEPLQRQMPDGSGPDAVYEDISVPGDKRTIRVWRFLDDEHDGK